MNQRNIAIDIFRGLTVALMVCVNDFWAVYDVPHFLEHFAVMEDGMGLSDIIYPMFLFAMGMSVPLALERRLGRGEGLASTLRHIFGRTLALLLMGSDSSWCGTIIPQIPGLKGLCALPGRCFWWAWP